MHIVIADDEPMARMLLRSLLDELHNEFDMKIVGEAETGEDLIALLSEQPVHLAFVDINMPSGNGLEAIQRCKERYPDVIWVLISGYAQFEYAQAAIRLEVSEYLLKPVELDDLRRVLQVTEGHLIRSLYQQNEERSQQQIKLLLRDPKGTLFAHSLDPGLVLSVTKIVIDRAVDLPITDEQQLLMQSLRERFLRFVREDRFFTIAAVSPEHLLIVFGSRKQEEDQTLLALDKSIRECMAACPLSCTAVSFSSASPQQIPRTLHALDASLPVRLIEGCSRVYHQQEQVPEVITAWDQVTRALYAQEYLTALHHLQGIPSDGGRELNSCQLNRLAAFVFRLFPSSCEPQEHPETHSWEGILKVMTQAVRERLAANQTDRDQIDRIVSYVREHYMENIGINTIADMYGITPNYLSMLFHKKMKQTFTEYLVAMRIKKAKELLQHNACITVKEVAQQVGYSSSRYFTRLFVKHCGQYPSEYRDQRL